jgi:tripartite-type tricarboxylate transporter receptor subunit TctC
MRLRRQFEFYKKEKLFMTVLIRRWSMVLRVLLILICAFPFVGRNPANAAEYPSKVITIIVPFSAGGPSDTIARLLAQTMSASPKTQVIVENVAGAGGTIGAARVVQAPRDGYTLCVHPIGHATAPALYRKLTYNPITDFEPVGLINHGAMTLVARKDFPVKNIKELIACVKANKD